MNRKRKTGIGLMAAGILLMTAAICLLGYNRREDRRAGEDAAKLLPGIRQEMAVRRSVAVEESSFLISEEENSVLPEGEFSEGEASDPSAQEVAAMLDGYDYIGILTIPALGLELPVMAEWDYAKLRIAPCRYAGSAARGDLVISAHNYSRHFGRLKSLASGEDVKFTDMEGNTTFYAVAETEILEPTAVEEMTASDYTLTLFTCTYGGQTRVTVRCDYRYLTENPATQNSSTQNLAEEKKDAAALP